jgi:double-stranded uracil-DNA glycosylase
MFRIRAVILSGMNGLLVSFPPLIAPDSRVLILGSMPGAESLRRQEYYAHPRNAFWRIIAELFGAGEPGSYEAKKRLLLREGLALWDVAGSCRREGSLDQRIRDVVPNDFSSLFADCPRISHIFFNGAKAAELFTKWAGPPAGVKAMRLPSTSPAYTMPYTGKLAAWRIVAEVLSG